MTKAYVHMSKALRGLGRYKEAVSVLEVAEEQANQYKEVIAKYKEEAIKEMKQDMLNNVKKLEG